jgi:hypothetical protein
MVGVDYNSATVEECLYYQCRRHRVGTDRVARIFGVGRMKVGDLVKQRMRGTDYYLGIGIGIIIEIRSRNYRVRWVNPIYGCSWAGPGILELVE